MSNENARYCVIYSKPTGSGLAMRTWKDTLQEADALTEQLERVGYNVDIWKHTDFGARPIYSKSSLLRAAIDTMSHDEPEAPSQDGEDLEL